MVPVLREPLVLTGETLGLALRSPCPAGGDSTLGVRTYQSSGETRVLPSVSSPAGGGDSALVSGAPRLFVL